MCLQRLKKWLFAAISCLLVCSTAFAQQDTIALNGGWLWQVSGGDLTKPSYLLGTNHNTDGDFVTQIYGFRKAMKDVINIAVEGGVTPSGVITANNKNGATPKDKQPVMLKSYKLMPADVTYRSLFDDENQYKCVNAFLLKINKDYQKLKPGVWAGSLHTALGFRPHINRDIIDMRVAQYVNFDSKRKLHNLEDVDEVMTHSDGIDSIAFCTYPLRLQAKMPLVVAQKFDSLWRTPNMIDVLYRQQNMRKIIEYFDSVSNVIRTSKACFTLTAADSVAMDSVRRYGEQFSHWLKEERNAKWIPTIITLMRDNPTMVAVGLRHLPGKDGLINMLRKKGYKVEPVLKN
jgi:uncharacterized protein YbaP (TraB family)